MNYVIKLPMETLISVFYNLGIFGLISFPFFWCKQNKQFLSFSNSVYHKISTTGMDSIAEFVKKLINMRVDWRLFLEDMKILALIAGNLGNFYLCIF